MKRPVERQMQLPDLEVIHNILGGHPVSVVLEWDWRSTGECHLSYTTRNSLVQCHQALQFVSNFIADELWITDETRNKLNGADTENPPGKDTDGLPF